MECPWQGSCFFVAVLAFLATGAFAQEESKCSIIADIGILVDSSGSLKREFHKEKQFVRDVATALTVSKTGVNIGVVTFSYFAELSIKLSDTQDTASFNRAVDEKVKLMGSQTYIDRGLHKAHTELFTEANGDRKEAPNFLLLLTDGKQTRSIYSTPPEAKAEALRKSGVTVIAIGIGRRVDALELATLTGSLDNVFLTRSFDDLLTGGFLNKIVSKTCAKAVEKPLVLCHPAVDIGFLMDSSQYEKQNFLNVKAFVKRIVNGFVVNATGPRAGLASFGNDAALKIPFSDYKTPKTFQSAVDGLSQSGNSRRMGKGISLAYDDLFNVRNGARENVPELLFLITTGSQSKVAGYRDPRFSAESFHEVGKKIIAVGVGPLVDKDELIGITKNKDNVFVVQKSSDLADKKFWKKLTLEACLGSVQKCKSLLDLGFIVDSSGSLKREYHKEKEFVKALAKSFRVGLSRTRSGIITFSSFPKLNVKLSQYDSVDDFNAAVDKLPHMGLQTRIDKALRMAENQFFTVENGARPGVPKMLILLTDGSQTKSADAVDPGDIADELRSKYGIKIIVIGIGKSINSTELEHIAGGSSKVYTAANFDSLLAPEFIQQISLSSCKSSTGNDDSCYTAADVGFVVDSSGSVKNEYAKEKEFVDLLSQKLELFSFDSRAKGALVLFSKEANLEIKFSDLNKLSDFQKAVAKLPLMGSVTRIDKALKVAYQDMFSPANGARANVSKLLILLTDGKQTVEFGSLSPMEAIRPFHQAGITVIVIGIGPAVDPAELVSMVKNPKNMYLAKDFNELKSVDFVSNIFEASCSLPIPKCASKGDFFFIVDSSGSIGKHFGKEKNFVKRFVNAMAFSSRAGIITFAKKPVVNLKLVDYKSKEEFNKIIDELSLLGSTTRIDKALLKVREELRQFKKEDFFTQPKIVFLLTDGSQTPDSDVVDPSAVGEEIRRMGAKIFILGIGSGVKEKELQKIAGDPGNLFLKNNFNEFNSQTFIQRVSDIACKTVYKPLTCDSRVDLGFALDSSVSKSSEFATLKNVIKQIAGRFQISQAKAQTGLMLLSDSSSVNINLNQARDLKKFSNAVDALAMMKGSVPIDKILKNAYNTLFNSKNGARLSAPQVLIVLTAEDKQDRSAIANAMKPFKEAAIKVVIVGIGKTFKGVNLINVVDDEKDLIHISGSENTDKSVDTITDRICHASVPKCSNLANVGFILDSSGSLRSQYDKEKEFVKALAGSFAIHDTWSRAGVVTFSHEAELSIRFTDYNNTNDFQKAVDRIGLLGSTTRMDKALLLAKNKLMTDARADLPKLLILLTDGVQTSDRDSIDPAEISRKIRELGIMFIVIGIGRAIDKVELTRIAGKSTDLFIADDFDLLRSAQFVSKVLSSACKKVEEKPVCKGVADVGFIVDSSGSLRREYPKEKDFVKLVASSLDIAPKGSHAGVVLFSYDAKLSIKFSDHTNYKDFETAVNGLPLMASTTRIDKALTMAYDNMFNERNGMRVKVPKVLILLTDGAQTNDPDAIAPAQAVARFHDAGIKVIVIGIGKGVKKDELETIVSSQENLFIAANFDQLKSEKFVKSIIGSTCLQASVAPCDNIADIGFIVDSSGSVRRDYGKEKEFVKTLSDILGVSADGSRASIVTFSYDAELSAKLSDYKSSSEFKSAVDRLPFMGYTTRIDKALKVAKDEMFLKSNGARASVPKILFVLTDGAQTKDSDAVDPSDIAKSIRDSGVTVIVVGIGSKVKSSELALIAGDKQSFFLAKNFDHLKSADFLQSISSRSCPAAVAPLLDEIGCRARADVGFIVDSSGSLSDEYGKEKAFVKSLAKKFDISAQGSHAGIVLFSDTAEVRVKFSEKNDGAEFNDAVDQLPLFGKTTRIDKALQLAHNTLFQPQNGMRLDVPQLLIVLTDGAQTNAIDAIPPAQAIAPFHESGIKVVVIGVGSGVKRDELQSMVKSGNDLYVAKNFDQLISGQFVDNVTAASCQQAPKCKNRVDIGFIVDSSGSLKREYSKEKEFVKALADSFSISQDGSRGGVITFSWHAELSVNLSDYVNSRDFNKAVDGLPFFGHTTRIDKALLLARDQLFTTKNGGRASIPKVLVLLTDGAQTADADAVNPGDIATEIRQAGVRLIVIGIGKKVDSKELLRIAGDKSNVYQAGNFDELKSSAFVESVSKTGCQLSEKPFECKAHVDIGFVIDSANVTESEFLQQKHFMKNIADSFGKSSNGSRFGLIASENSAEKLLKLTDHASASDFKRAVDKLKKSQSDAMRMDKTIERAYKELFNPINGARLVAPRILIVLSARESFGNTDPKSISKAVGPFHEDDTKVIVLGIGPGAKNPYLQMLAREPNDMYLVKQFDELSTHTLKTRIAKKACKSTVVKCKNVANVGFIVDSSGSLRREYFKERDFVKQLADSFEISEAGSRAGVVTFSYDAELSIGMNEHRSVKDFNKAVDNLPFFGSTTRIDKALKLAKQQLMVGARTDAPRVVFLLTDGSQTPSADAVDPAIVSKELRDDGIQLIVIGIGKNTKVAELRAIAGQQSNVYLAKDFDELQSRTFVQEISNAACTRAKVKCIGTGDIGFIVDSSASLFTEYLKEKQFLKNFVTELKVSPNGYHIGVVIFSEHSQLSIKFSDHSSVEAVNIAIDGLPLLGSTTRIDRALKTAFIDLFSVKNGMRPRVPKVLVLLTDGEQTQDSDSIAPYEAVKPFNDAGIKVIVIGIGSKINRDELSKMVNSKQDLYFARDFDQLKSKAFVQNITAASCKAKVKEDPKADIGLIIDTSASFDESDFVSLKELVSKLAGRYKISANKNRIGALLFSNEKWKTIPLDMYLNSTVFGDNLRNIALMNSVASVDEQLKLAYETLFSPEGSSRIGVPKLIVLVTHTNSLRTANEAALKEAMRPIQQSGIRVLVAAVGQADTLPFSNAIIRTKDDLFLVPDLENSLKDNFLEAVVNGSMTTIVNMRRQPCVKTIDFSFIIGTSNVPMGQLPLAKKFVSRLFSRFNAESTAGVIDLNPLSHNGVSFVKTVKDLDEKLRVLPKAAVKPNAEQVIIALKYAVSRILAQTSRPSAAKLIVLVANTEDVDLGQVQKEASGLKQELAANDIRLLVVAVDANNDARHFASLTAYSRDIVKIENFPQLLEKQAETSLALAICQVAGRPRGTKIPPPGGIVKSFTCKKPHDIAIFVDATVDNNGGLSSQLNFVTQLANLFVISASNTMFSIGTFKKTANVIIPFSDTYADQSLLKDAVDAIRFLNGGIVDGIALEVAVSTLFSKQRKDRSSRSKILIIITKNGESLKQNKQTFNLALKALEGRGVRPIFIVIGDKNSNSGATSLVGQTIHSDSFKSLSSAQTVLDVAKKICGDTDGKEKSCGSKIDVVFALDATQSNLNSYADQKEVVKLLVTKMSSRFSKYRIGLLVYGSNSWTTKYLKQDMSPSLINNLIDNLPPMGENRRIDLALATANSMFKSPSSTGHNRDILSDDAKVLVFFASGAQKQGGITPRDASRPLHDMGVRTIAVGVGNFAGSMLRDVVGSHGSLFNLPKSRSMDIAAETLLEKVCKEATTYIVDSKKCKNIADIAFLVDSSASMRRDYEKQIKVIEYIAEQFEISPRLTHAAVVLFGRYAKIEIPFGSQQTLAKFKDALKSMPFIGGSGKLDEGLYAAQSLLMGYQNGARANLPKILFVITDGSQTGPLPRFRQTPADLLKRMNIPIIILGIGGAVNRLELENIAGSPEHVFLGKDPDSFLAAGYMDKVVRTACNSVRAVPRIGSGTAPKPLNFMQLQTLMAYQLRLNSLLQNGGPDLNQLGIGTRLAANLPDTYACSLTKRLDRSLQKAFSGTATGPSLLQKALSLNATSFVDLIYALDMVNELERKGKELTLLLPSNEAFVRLSAQEKNRLKNPCFLRKVIRYHLAEGKRYLKEVGNNEKIITLLNKPVFYTKFEQAKSIGGANVISADNPSRNGVIHLLDSVLFLPEKSLYEMILSDKRLQLFTRGALQTGSDSFLKSGEQVTVFAPSDTAFNALPSGMLAQLLLKPALMQELIQHHIHKGTVYTGVLKNGNYGVKPLRGKVLRLNKKTPKATTINMDSTIVVKDLKAVNGVLHIIDKVLLP